jgi:hypothetical protein
MLTAPSFVTTGNSLTGREPIAAPPILLPGHGLFDGGRPFAAPISADQDQSPP